MLQTCPQCKSLSFKRNGYTRHGKQNNLCRSCGRQFCTDPKHNLERCNNEFPLTMMIERIEADELWRCDTKSRGKQWVWIAMDADSQQLIAFYVDSESKNGAEEVWRLIPEEYKQKAKIYTDLYALFKNVITENQHFRLLPLNKDYANL